MPTYRNPNVIDFERIRLLEVAVQAAAREYGFIIRRFSAEQDGDRDPLLVVELAQLSRPPKDA